MEVFAKTFDVPTAYEVIRKRSGKWFDPELVRWQANSKMMRTLSGMTFTDTRNALLSMEFAASGGRVEQRIDAICDAFAQIVDAKSPFTAEHSSASAIIAVQMAGSDGVYRDRLTTLRRAALLHDLGKLAVSNTILDKPGKPMDEEWASIRKHPFSRRRFCSTLTDLSA